MIRSPSAVTTTRVPAPSRITRTCLQAGDPLANSVYLTRDNVLRHRRANDIRRRLYAPSSYNHPAPPEWPAGIPSLDSHASSGSGDPVAGRGGGSWNHVVALDTVSKNGNAALDFTAGSATPPSEMSCCKRAVRSPECACSSLISTSSSLSASNRITPERDCGCRVREPLKYRPNARARIQ